MRMLQMGLFDQEERMEKLSKLGDSLVKLNKTIDWEKDSQLISSAINKVAGQEIRAVPYIHWWTFMGYFSAIGESPLSTVLSIRNKLVKGKKLEKWEREFRMSSPQYFKWNSKSLEQRQADREILSLWNNSESR